MSERERENEKSFELTNADYTRIVAQYIDICCFEEVSIMQMSASGI